MKGQDKEDLDLYMQLNVKNAFTNKDIERQKIKKEDLKKILLPMIGSEMVITQLYRNIYETSAKIPDDKKEEFLTECQSRALNHLDALYEKSDADVKDKITSFKEMIEKESKESKENSI